MEINIISYKLPLGGNQEVHERLSSELKELIKSNFKDLKTEVIDVYRIDGTHQYRIGSKNSRTLIFIGATSNITDSNYILDEPKPIFGIENNFTVFRPPINHDNNTIIYSPEGIALAEWEADYYQLNILFDLFDENVHEKKQIFIRLLDKVNREVFLPMTWENSWVHTSNKEKLCKEITEKLKEQKSNYLHQERNRVRDLEQSILSIREDLKHRVEQKEQKMRNIVREKENVDKVSDKIVKDLDSIIKLSKVEDLVIENQKFIVKTKPLYMYDDIDDRIFYAGRYTIKFHPTNTNIVIQGDNPRFGFWTRHDPHPHVGGNGNACFGNVENTIAELVAQSEIYALVTVLIDYLESVNINDSAGSYVKYWDEVDENGEIVEEGLNPDERIKCPACNDDYHEDDMVTVYDRIDEDGDPVGEHEVCVDCRDNDYKYIDELDVDVREY